MPLHCVAVCIPTTNKDSEQDAGYVRIYDWSTSAECKALDRSNRISSESFKRAKCNRVSRELAAMVGHNLLRDSMESFGAHVVAQRIPGSSYAT